MKNKIPQVFALMVFLLIGCKKEIPLVEVNNADKSRLTLKWSRNIDPSAFAVFPKNSSIDNNTWVYASFSSLESSRGCLHFVDARSGELLGTWNEFENLSDFNLGTNIKISNGIAIVNHYGNQTIWAIDVSTRTTLWKSKLPQYLISNNLEIFNGKIYLSVLSSTQTGFYRAALLSSPLESPNWQEHLITPNSQIPFIITNFQIQNENNVQMAYCRLLSDGFLSPNHSKLGFCKFNLDLNSMVWQQDSLEYGFSKLITDEEILIDNENLYVVSVFDLFKLKSDNGNIIWRYRYKHPDNHQLAATSLFKIGPYIILKPYSNALVSVDDRTGMASWIIRNIGTSNALNSRASMLKGFLIFPVNGKLVFFNPSTGERFEHEYSYSYPFSKVLVNETDNTIYWQDEFKAYCYEVLLE